jgi:hypothetical protein
MLHQYIELGDNDEGIWAIRFNFILWETVEERDQIHYGPTRLLLIFLDTVLAIAPPIQAANLFPGPWALRIYSGTLLDSLAQWLLRW